MLEDARRGLDESIAQTRPRYFAFVASSGLEIGVIGDLLASCFDANLAVWAAAATEIEDQAVRWVAEFLGFPAAAGAFTSGGTVSNMTALAAARERAIPGSRRRGLRGVSATVYCSNEAHYSIERAAEILGIGSDNVRALPIDGNRRLVPEQVAAAIRADRAAGRVPVAVVATAGTTLTGAVDPIGELADVCHDAGVWLHVDGAYGLPAATAPSTAHLFAGLDRVDSVTLDAHKWLYLPKACGVLLVRHREDLFDAFSHNESYIPHERTTGHMVDITLEYSRPFRALKLWLAFRAHGAQAFREAVEDNLRQARLLYELVRGERRARAAVRAAVALDRPLPAREDVRGPERPQLQARADAAGRRARLGRTRDRGREGRAAALLRQLPDDGRRRARTRGRGGRAGSRLTVGERFTAGSDLLATRP